MYNFLDETSSEDSSFKSDDSEFIDIIFIIEKIYNDFFEFYYIFLTFLIKIIFIMGRKRIFRKNDSKTRKTLELRRSKYRKIRKILILIYSCVKVKN